jgi:adenosylhomocysteine nucleosidase
MKPLLFVAADRRECAPWVKHWDESRPVSLPVHWARAGKWKGRPVMAIANGAGAPRATAAIAAAAVNTTSAPGAICSIGFCGALDDSFAIGDIFTAAEVRNGSGTWEAIDPRGRGAKTGVLISTAFVVRTASEKRKLWANGGAAVEMEAAAVARASEELNVPFYCIRAVSDLANEDFANDFNSFLMPNGRFSVSRLVLGALASPIGRFGELIRLSRRTRLASNNLGEFLAGCAF